MTKRQNPLLETEGDIAATHWDDCTVPSLNDYCKTKILLCKPLRDHLNGLLNKIDVQSDQRNIQAVIDCTLFLLIELQRIDQTGGADHA